MAWLSLATLQGRETPLSAQIVAMANQAKMTIRVGSSRGASNISASTAGKYVSLQTNGIVISLPRSAIQPTSSSGAFWRSVLAVVSAQVALLP